MTQTRRSTDYHHYLAESPESKPWGIAVTAAGCQTSRAGASYPPVGHPADHAFSWHHGRVLGACQIVFITAGRGEFESRATGRRRIQAGTVLIILPGHWHRYRPDPNSGWVEHWVEIRGAVVENLQRAGVLSPQRAIVQVERPLELMSLFEGIHARLSADTSLVCDPERAALGLQILAFVSNARERAVAARSITTAIGRAGRMMADALEKPLAIPAIARELGVAYSYFRREFKRHTGLSPHRYRSQMRLEKARRLIGVSNEPLKTIADRLGFSSQYHLSSAFKRQFGLPPSAWRKRVPVSRSHSATIKLRLARPSLPAPASR